MVFPFTFSSPTPSWETRTTLLTKTSMLEWSLGPFWKKSLRNPLSELCWAFSKIMCKYLTVCLKKLFWKARRLRAFLYSVKSLSHSKMGTNFSISRVWVNESQKLWYFWADLNSLLNTKMHGGGGVFKIITPNKLSSTWASCWQRPNIARTTDFSNFFFRRVPNLTPNN